MIDKTKAEQERRKGIRDACQSADEPPATADYLIDQGVPLVEAQRRIFDAYKLRKRFVRRLPLEFIERADAQLQAQWTGQMNINAHQGRIVNAEIRERHKNAPRASSVGPATALE